MKIVKVVLIMVAAAILYHWVNDSGTGTLTLIDLLPFSTTSIHSASYNYCVVVMLCLAIWGLRKRSDKNDQP